MLLVCLLVVMGGLAPYAEAQEDGGETDESSTLTWSVRPTPSEAEPERPNFSYDVEPGVTLEDSIRVRNYGTEPLPLLIYASDALTTSTGALDLLPAGETPVGVGAWITLETGNITVPGQSAVDVPFTMTVPANAESGDHTGGIVTSFVSEESDSANQPVVVDRRLGSRVQVRVAGELQPAIEVTDLTVDYGGTLNPFSSGTLAVAYTVTNTGNVRLAAEQRVHVAGPLGLLGIEADLDPMPELLPGDSLQFSAEVPGVWPTFRTAASVVLEPRSTRPGDEFDPDTPSATAESSLWTVPWSQIGLVLVLVLIPFWVRWSRSRRKRKEDAAIRQAVQVAVAVQEALQTHQTTQEPPTPSTPPDTENDASERNHP